MPAALTLPAAFVGWEALYQRRRREPLVDLSLFRLRFYSFGSSLITFYFAGFTPLFFVFTLCLQIGLQYSALLAGLAITPFAVGSGIAARLGGRIVYRFGRALVAAGFALVAIGLAASMLAVHLAPDHDTAWARLAPLFVVGFGGGLVITPNLTLSLSQVPVARAGTAGGLLQTGQRIGAAVGIAAVGSVFFAWVAANHGQGYASAYQDGVLVALAFVVAALIAAVLDVAIDRRRAHGRHEA